uniref:SH3-domain kinase binding protein 1 n=1 Tax=Paramormyrops kingsleyae TaxID=1676925 RepID=A0A3B3Q789_9TELE
MTLVVGDIISNIHKNEGGWWQGELAGRRGLFPDNFVKVSSRALSAPMQPVHWSSQCPCTRLYTGNVRRRWCMATFSYTPQHKDELELKPGDVIEITEEVEEGWWEGRLNGKMGMFPSNFTRKYAEDAEDQDGCPSAPDSSSGTETQSKEPECGSLRLVNSSEIQPEQLRAPAFGDILRDKHSSMNQDGGMEKVRLCCLPTLNTVHRKRPHFCLHSKVREMTNAEAVGKIKAREFCKAMFSYEAQNEDELSIKEGDIVAIINKECVDPGWWQGELQGRQGIFPDNFVRLLVLDEETVVSLLLPSVSVFVTLVLFISVLCLGVSYCHAIYLCVSEFILLVDELKPGVDIQKSGRPAIPPKKPLLLKPTKLLGQPAIDSVMPPQKPEKPSFCSFSSTKEVEDFDSIVTTSEKLNHLTATRPRVADRRPRTQGLQHVSGPAVGCVHAFSLLGVCGGHLTLCFTLLGTAAAFGIRLLLPPKPAMIPPSGAFSSHGPDTKSRSESVSVEELRTQLRDLRGTVELMGKQHKKEIKQLMNELDEEKKIRLSLQVQKCINPNIH